MPMPHFQDFLLNQLIKKNIFPYGWKRKDWKHDCLWINPSVDDRWTDNMIIELCNLKYRNKRIIYFFENEDKMKSVLKIRHYHIIYEIDYSICNKLKCNI